MKKKDSGTKSSQTNGISSPADPSATPRDGVKMEFRLSRMVLDKRLLPPALITLILVGAHISFGILDGYDKILLSIGTCIATELCLSRIFLKRWPHLASSYISGNSVGILLRSAAYWPFAICSALTIASKYVLRYDDRHLWNPSNFGVSAVFFLAPFVVAPLSIQWGNNFWPVVTIWIVGVIVLLRLKRFHVCAAYALGFVIFAGVRAWFSGEHFLVEISPITGPMYQLFILFMITDPKTTVRSRNGRISVAVLIAFVEMLFRMGEVIFAPFYALFIVGPIALIIESRLGVNGSRESEREEGLSPPGA